MEVKLEELNVNHAKDLVNCLNNKDVLKTLSGFKYPFTLKASIDYIKESVNNKDKYEFAIIYENNLVGGIVLENPNSNKKIFEVGYYIAKPYRGKGIATKALIEITKYGFNKLKLKKIWAGIISNNPSSGKVLEKAGFKLEGIQRKHIFKNNRYYDELSYGLLNKL
jgi:[ribosomal protein S5]-alanine N-acetyltransferase